MKCLGYSKSTGKRCENSAKFLFCRHHLKRPVPFFLPSFLKTLLSSLILIFTFFIFFEDSVQITMAWKNRIFSLIGIDPEIRIFSRPLDNNTYQIFITNLSDIPILISDIEVVIDAKERLYSYEDQACMVLTESKYDIFVDVHKRDNKSFRPDFYHGIVAHSIIKNETENFLIELKLVDPAYFLKFHFIFSHNKRIVAKTRSFIKIARCAQQLPGSEYHDYLKNGDEEFINGVYNYSFRSPKLDSIISQKNMDIITETLRGSEQKDYFYIDDKKIVNKMKSYSSSIN